MIQVLAPVVPIVTKFIHVPDVGNVMFLEIAVHTLADTDQPILVPATEVQQP